MQTSKIQLSSAQLLAINATPVDIVPAPGAGKIVTIVALVYSGHFGSAAYINGSALGLIYAGTAKAPSADVCTAAVVNAAADHVSVMAIGTLDAVDDTPANIANKAIQLKAVGAAFTTGDGTATVTAFYNTASLA